MGNPQPIVIGKNTEADGGLSAREGRILRGEPVEFVQIPGRDEPVPIYPKPNGYFYLILNQFQRYLNALTMMEMWQAEGRPVYKRRFWQSRARAMRLYAKRLHAWEDSQQEAADEVGAAKYALLRLILSDSYHKDRNVALEHHEYMAMPWDTVVQIVDAYQKANNVEDLLSRLIPGYKEKKSPALEEHLSRVREAASLRV